MLHPLPIHYTISSVPYHMHIYHFRLCATFALLLKNNIVHVYIVQQATVISVISDAFAFCPWRHSTTMTLPIGRHSAFVASSHAHPNDRCCDCPAPCADHICGPCSRSAVSWLLCPGHPFRFAPPNRRCRVRCVGVSHRRVRPCTWAYRHVYYQSYGRP